MTINTSFKSFSFYSIKPQLRPNLKGQLVVEERVLVVCHCASRGENEIWEL